MYIYYYGVGMGGKITYEENEMFVNHVTGEVLMESHTQIKRLPIEPPFIKLYLDEIIKISNLPKGNSAVLYQFIRLVDYDGEVNLSPHLKNKMVRIIGMKNAKSLDNAISSLIKGNIMKRIGRGSFVLNPNLFAKGSWNNVHHLRDKYINLNIRFFPNGKKEIVSTIEKINK
jgi:hypothetical protein